MKDFHLKNCDVDLQTDVDIHIFNAYKRLGHKTTAVCKTTDVMSDNIKALK